MFRKGLEFGPKMDYRLWVGLILSVQSSGATDKALCLCDDLLAKYPREADLLETVAWSLESLGPNPLLSKAEGIARAAVKSRPDKPRGHYVLARVLCTANRIGEALKEAELVLGTYGSGLQPDH